MPHRHDSADITRHASAYRRRSSSTPSTAHSGKPRCFSWRCFTCSLATFVLLAAAAGVVYGVLYYLRWDEHRRETRAAYGYLRELVERVNSAHDARWKARFNPHGIRKEQAVDYKTLKNLTAVKEYVAHLERFFASDQMREHLSELTDFPSSTLPRRFDAREKWPHCTSLQHVPNQGGCGSCFAFASMGVASDRTCIYTNGSHRGELSVQDVLGCCRVCGDCYGGDPIKALVYWALEGVVSGGRDGCVPYTVAGADCGTPCRPDVYPLAEARRKCERKCQPGYYKHAYGDDKHYGSIAYTLFPRKMSIDQAGKDRVMLPSIVGHFNKTSPKPLTPLEIRQLIQKELYLYGPTTMAMPLTEEFLHYDSGIFHPYPVEDFEKRIIYWHVVRLIGWGHDDTAGGGKDGRHYWLAINSFGSEWGEHGTFRVDTELVEKFGLEYETGLL